jgi:TRAP-type uncharacterized transport system substrate-binding protein
VDVNGAGTAITAVRVFELLGIPVHTVNYDPEEALEKLRSGDVVAVALVAGKPAPLFCDLIGENGLHFLPIALDPAVRARHISAPHCCGLPGNDPIQPANRYCGCGDRTCCK